MTIHKEGRALLSGLGAILFLVFGITTLYSDANSNAIPIVAILTIFIFLLVLQFFRIPNKNIILNPNIVLSPANGKVVVIEETVEPEYFKDRRIQVSIFMSPLDVHNNLNPISGIVRYFKYHPGKFLVAWHPKSSTDNERTTLVVEAPFGQVILLRQIAGALARRICWYVKPGQLVQQGQEFGFIKFGSRVDVFLPLGTEILCQLNQKSVGGITPIAKLK